jgi:hypothetical protein
MTDIHKQAKALTLGAESKRILESEAFKAAEAKLGYELYLAWADTGLNDTEKREELHKMHQAFQMLKSKFIEMAGEADRINNELEKSEDGNVKA